MQTASIVRADDLSWQPSPSPSVWRKRLFHQGPPEAGMVTSIVRFEPGSEFPHHGHPDGEEVFVLEGVYSDARGSFPAGTFLLSPQGFEHAPFSIEGCLLLVRLRQYAGADRASVVLDTRAGHWVALAPGVRRLALYDSARYAESKSLIELQPGAALPPREWREGVELFVIKGELGVEERRYPRHTWLRLPRGAARRLRTAQGCMLYISQPGLKLADSRSESGLAQRG